MISIKRFFPFYTIVLVILDSIVAEQTRKCSKQSDCVDQYAPRCAICADIDGGQSGACVDVYKKIFLSSPICAKYCPLKCGKGKCDIIETANASHAAPYCKCPGRSSFGERCQHDNPEGLPMFNYVSVHFVETMASLGDNYFFSIGVYSESYELNERKSVLIVKSADYRDYEAIIFKPSEEISFPYSITFPILIKFPFKIQEGVYRLGDKMIGYKTSFQIKVLTDEKEVFSETHDVFVKYEDVRCFPIISPKHCSHSKLDPEVIHRNDALQKEFDVDYLYEGRIISSSMDDQLCSIDEKISWMIWKITKNTKRKLLTHENYTRSRSVSLEPYELEIGLYEVNIGVRNVGLKKTFTNSINCNFKVGCAPLVAKVRGGSDRIVSPSLSLVLRADNSFDPNMPPNDQSHLNIEWTCVNLLDPDKHETMCEAKRTVVSQYYSVPAESLTPGAKYNFTMKVWTDKYVQMEDCDQNISPQFSYLILEVAQSNISRLDNVVIECVINCGAKVVASNELVLKAVQPFMINVPPKDTYEWTFYENSKEMVFDDKIIKGAHSYLLTVKRNSLNHGSLYRIQVRVKKSTWYATYSFETFSIGFDVNCSLTPTEGTKGLTQFEISCVLIIINKNSNYLFNFEFYDKNKEEENDDFIFSGRMLGTSRDGSLKYVRLTRGNLLIYIITQHGTYIKKVIKVELKDWAIDDTILGKLYQNVAKELRIGNVQTTLGALSFIPDIVPVTMEKNKGEILTTLLGFATKVSLKDFGDMKLSVSSLTNVLLVMNHPYQHQLKPHILIVTFKCIKNQVEKFNTKIFNGEVNNMSPQEVKQVAVSIINSLRAGLLSKDNQTVNIQEWSSDFSLFNDLKKVSVDVEITINLISKTLSYVQVPGHPPTRLSSKDETIIVWVMESDDHYTFPEIISAEDGIPVHLSFKLYNKTYLSLNEGENIVLQVTSLKDNIYWWRSSNIKSNLVSVTINRQYNKTHILPIRFLDPPLTIILDLVNDIKSLTIKDTTSLPKSDSDTYDWDLNLKVHRFDLEPRSVVTITFLFPETNATLRVLVKDQFRPDYTSIEKEGVNITQTSTTYIVPYYNHITSYFIYMGVIPGAEVPTNKSFSYAFNIHVAICQSWALGHWNSAGCVVNRVVKAKQVHCECKHFSIFAAAIPMPPNSIDSFLDVTVYLSSTLNPIVVLFVIGVLLIYLLLCVYLWVHDRRAVDKRSVIILEDNVSIDNIPYLVGVYTSHRLNAGTTAHVGIQINGTKGKGRPHILSCKYRNVLQRNSDDWFLIYCQRHLGDVEGLRIWHDNVGSSPEWFCNKIVVYDLLEDRETIFIVEGWLALNTDEHPEAYVLSASIEEINSVKTLFINNLTLGLRENHGPFNIVRSHPRSRMPKLSRFNIFFSSFMFSMLCCIMSNLPEDEQMYYVDTYQYTVGTRHLVIGLQTMVISILPSLILCFLFQKSYKIIYDKRKSTLRLRDDSLSYLEPDVHTNKSTLIYSYGTMPKVPAIGGSIYQTFVRMLTKIVKQSSMDPVQLPNSEPIVAVRWFWLILYWVVCLTIIGVSSYLVILYGMKLGFVRSKDWLSSLCISMGVEIVLFAPFRIAIVSSLLAIAYLKMFDMEFYDVKPDDLRRTQLPKSTKQILNVAKMRELPMYKPITNEQRGIILKRMEIQSKIHTFYEFLVTILILFVFLMVMSKIRIMHFHSNVHAVNMITLTNIYIHESVDFYDLKSFSSFNTYIQHNFIDHLYNQRWYNHRLLHSDENGETNEYWTSDYTQRPFGPPVIRQLRVVPQRCSNIVLKRSYCIPRWSNRTEENDDYSEMWQPAFWRDAEGENSSWRYTHIKGNWILDQYRLYSPTGVTYVAGGYLKVLGPTRDDTEVKLAELVEHSWLDEKTRVVFVEFFLYNVNGDAFVKVTLMVEHLISGNIRSTARALSFKARKYPNVWVFLLVPLVVYYLLKCVHLFSRQGIVKSVYHYNNLTRFLIVFLGTASLILFTIYYYVSVKHLKLLHKQALDKSYFDFDTLLLYYVLLYHVQTIALCSVYLHAISLAKSKNFIGQVNFIKRSNFTFIKTVNWIFWLTVNVVILSVSLKLIGKLFDDHGLYNVKNIMIIKRSHRNLQLEEYQCLHTNIFAFTRIVIITICLWSFVIMFMAKMSKYK